MRFASIIFILVLSFFSACKKEAGPGGKNSIAGTVLYKNGTTGNNDAAAGATVYIAFGTNESTSEFDQIILTDASGKYSLRGLHKGKYFIKAAFTDSHGFNYSTAGSAIEIKNKKSDLVVDLVLE